MTFVFLGGFGPPRFRCSTQVGGTGCCTYLVFVLCRFEALLPVRVDGGVVGGGTACRVEVQLLTVCSLVVCRERSSESWGRGDHGVASAVSMRPCLP